MSNADPEPKTPPESETPAEAPSQPSPGDVIEALNAENADLKDRLMRAVAEAENVRKRAERERIDAAKYGISKFARDVVVVADNLARALKAVPADRKEDPALRTLSDGVELTERELLAVLERNGIKRIIPKGEPFNPNFHQAVAEIASPGIAPGTVIEVIEAGYVIEDRLLRPAMVVVAKGEAGTGTKVDTKA
jgi:molecular chaperone GrpE